MAKIKEAYVFIAEDTNPNDEGLVAAEIGEGLFSTLIATTHSKALQLKPLAEKIAKSNGLKVRLVKFKARTDVELLQSTKKRKHAYIYLRMWKKLWKKEKEKTIQ